MRGPKGSDLALSPPYPLPLTPYLLLAPTPTTVGTGHTTGASQDRPGALGADLDEVPGQGVLVGGGRRGGTGSGGGVHGESPGSVSGYRRYPEDLQRAMTSGNVFYGNDLQPVVALGGWLLVDRGRARSSPWGEPPMTNSQSPLYPCRCLYPTLTPRPTLPSGGP